MDIIIRDVEEKDGRYKVKYKDGGGGFFYVDKQTAEVIRPEPQKIADIIDGIKLNQAGWEGGEDIVLLNGEPIGMTITKHNREFDRWLPAFKAILKAKIEKALE